MKIQHFVSAYEHLLKAEKVLSQTDFADKIGFGKSYISQILKAAPNRDAPRKVVVALMEAFPETKVYELESASVYKSLVEEGQRYNTAIPITRTPDLTRARYVNEHGNEFEPLTDGTFLVHHKHVLGPVHAAYAAGWGDKEFTNSLPERTTIVKEVSEDLFVSFTVVGECQDDGTIAGVVPGMELTGQSLPRSMWKYKFPFESPSTKPHKIKSGNKEIELPEKSRRHRYWIIVDRFKGMRVAMIKSQDVEKGILHCCCRNPDKKAYPDFDINLDDCSQIFFVIKRVMND